MSAARRIGAGVVVLAVVALAVLGLVRAAHPRGPESLQDRADAVAATLRCPTCNGLSVRDSSSVLAQGARTTIEQQLAQGRSPDQVRQYFVDRYGPSVLLDPSPSGAGLLAWVLPGVVLAGAALLAWRWTRRGRPAGGGAAAAADDAAAALSAYRDGRLVPDDSPSGEALREALLARLALDEEQAPGATPDEELVARGDRRLAEAYRRYRARPAAVAGQRRRSVPRRAVLLGSAAAVVLAAGAGMLVTVRDAASPAAAAGPAAGSPGPSAMAAPSPPPGWTGGMPKTADDWVALGRAYDKDQQLAQARAAYEMALRLRPGDDGVTLLRADVLVRSGSAAEALPDLRQLADRHPDSPDVLLILGLAENRTGSPDAAATLRRFLQLAPDSPAAPGVRKLLGAG